MKKIIYSLVIMIAAGSLFTSCLEYVEPVGIQQLRAAKADYLDALATLRLADAELQKANATYVLAMAAYQDALTEGQKIENRIREYDVQIKAARTEYEVDSLKKAKELLQVTHNTNMANAKATLAQAEENLRVALRNIAAVQHLLTAEEQKLLNDVTKTYEDAFNFYNAQVLALTKAKAKLWDLEYGFKDSIDWKADYQGQIDLYTAEIARAQAALKTVPERLDLEKWNAELENMKDSIDAYNYDRQATTRDSVYYMVNTYHEGVEEYERAIEAWLTKNGLNHDGAGNLTGVKVPWEKGFDGKDLKAAPVEPTKPNFSGKDARLNWEFIESTTDIAAKLVYDKFVDLIVDYKQPAPFGKDSTVANGGYYGNVFPGVGFDTLRINATVDMKDFILNDSTPNVRTYVWKRSNGTKVTSVGKYGLKGAIDLLERELVFKDKASDVPAKQAAYDAAKLAWETDRAYLINKTHLADEAAALADMKTSVIIPTPTAKDGRVEDLLYAIRDFEISRTNNGKNSSTADTVQFIQAVSSFVKAKAAYIGQAYKGYDSIEFKDAMNNDQKLYLGDLKLAGFVQKKVDPAPKFSSIYGGKNYTTEGPNDLNMAPTNGDDDAILKVLRVLFPNNLAQLANWGVASPWIKGAAFTADALDWFVYDAAGNKFNAAKAPSLEYDRDKADLNLVGKGTTEFLKVYNRFWNPAVPAVGMATAIYKDDAGCYTWNTFCDPYRLVRFTGNNINQNQDLQVILSLVDPNKATLPLTHQWNDVNNQSAILGTPGRPTEFRAMLLAEQDLILEKAKTTYSATLAKLRGYVDGIEKDFDKKKKDMEDKYTADKEAYDFNVKAWKTYQANLTAKLEGFLTELTGKKDGKVVATIPTPVNYQVPSCMKEYLDHEGLPVYNGEYNLGGKQLEWANASLKDYPANLKKWMIEARTANHVIGHLNTLLGVLDPAYRAAVKIYTYDWKKYVLAVGADGKYDVNITAMKQDLGDSATDLIGFFENYNKYQKQYTDAWKQYLEDCEVELGFWKKVLARYNAGFDPLEIAIEEQKNIVAALEKKVELAKKFLDEAEAQYKATVAKLLNK